ncbi:MAG: winged helix-turn-helix transcriptional regulator [Clostridia bacterium]|nr:winged helix-turn-helix transcriptional regulator [Clostridia bacterium]
MQERFEAFTILIAKIGRAIRKIKTEEMAEFDLKSPHVSCLYYLYKEDGLTAAALCERCDEDKAAISRSLEYLEANGFLSCLSTAKKRYKAPLVLTEKGKRTGAYIAARIDEVLLEASEGLKEEDRRILYQSLTLISNNLQKICDRYGE